MYEFFKLTISSREIQEKKNRTLKPERKKKKYPRSHVAQRWYRECTQDSFEQVAYLYPQLIHKVFTWLVKTHPTKQ